MAPNIALLFAPAFIAQACFVESSSIHGATYCVHCQTLFGCDNFYCTSCLCWGYMRILIIQDQTWFLLFLDVDQNRWYQYWRSKWPGCAWDTSSALLREETYACRCYQGCYSKWSRCVWKLSLALPRSLCGLSYEHVSVCSVYIVFCGFAVGVVVFATDRLCSRFICL